MHSIAILRCPITRSDLAWVGDARIEELNERISAGSLRNLNGALVRRSLKRALVSANGAFVYPVEDDILILLPSLAIASNTGTTSDHDGHALDVNKESIMEFYDQIGWCETDQGLCEDGARFEDLRPVAAEYIHKCHMRVRRHIPARGTYLLDVASGAIQYPEHLTYSTGYGHRISADISFAALRQAKKKLGDRGIYLLCDITNLPLKDDLVEGFVSLHTLYHVPAEEQLNAVRELQRVLREGGSGVIVYSWGNHSLLMNLAMRLRPLRAMKKTLRKLLPDWLVIGTKKMLGRSSARSAAASPGSNHPAKPEETNLYFFAHDFAWYQDNVARPFKSDIASWRSVSVPFLKKFVRDKFFGRLLLTSLYHMESMFPRLLGKYGFYPMFIFHKASAAKHPFDKDGPSKMSPTESHSPRAK